MCCHAYAAAMMPRRHAPLRLPALMFTLSRCYALQMDGYDADYAAVAAISLISLLLCAYADVAALRLLRHADGASCCCQRCHYAYFRHTLRYYAMRTAMPIRCRRYA